MAGNNRPLGRSWTAHDSLSAAIESARLVSVRAADIHGLSSIDEQGAWRWLASLDGAAVAASVVRYPRRMECERALRQFVAAVGSAATEPSDLRLLGPSALRVYDIGGPSPAALG